LLEENKEGCCGLLSELPKPLLLEGNFDDISWFDGLPYRRDDDSTSLIQYWMEQACSSTCQSWYDLRNEKLI
jgi:hypothetical protein